jgi:REP element-mobilizing transposase RayT
MSFDVEPVKFGVFDKDGEVAESERYLPHWFQPGVVVFVTFRTEDSMPRSVVAQWQEEQRRWLRDQGVEDYLEGPLPDVESLPGSLQKGFRKLRDGRWHWHLDQCHGACVLRMPKLSSIVGDALLHFNGQRYDLDRFVVMPNHVHVLVQFRPPTTCRQQCTSWLRYTARQINQRLKRHNAFWQSEPFDHLLRSIDQFHYLQQYIADNPSKANLRPGEYLFWKR